MCKFAHVYNCYMNNKVKGYFLGAISAATYGMNPLFTLPLYEDGMDADSVLFFRYLFAIPILAIMLKWRRRSFRIERRQILPLVIMGILFAASSLTLYMSYNYMDAGIASTLLFVYPVMVAGIMTLFFKEKLTIQTVLCIVMALAGIGLLYEGGENGTLSLTGTLLVLGSALAYAIYIVGINRVGLENMATIKVTFYVLLFGWGLFAVRSWLFGDGLLLPNSWYMWVNIISLALFPTAISLICTTTAIQSIGSTPTAILGVLEPATAIFFGITVFGEVLTPRDCVGLAFIIASVCLVVMGGKNITYTLIRFRKMFPKLPIARRRKRLKLIRQRRN